MGQGARTAADSLLCSTSEWDLRTLPGESGVLLMVAENVRFDPAAQVVQQLIRDGWIGQPALAQRTREAYLRESFLHDQPWFLQAEAAGGGIMMSGGIHDVELLRMALEGEVESVHAVRTRQRFQEMEGDDTSVATLRFSDGTVAVLVESFLMKSAATAAGEEVHTLRIDGDLGSITLDAGSAIRLYSERPDASLAGARTERLLRVPEEDTFLLEAEHFLHCVETGEDPITDGRSQRRVLQVVMANYESMRTGRVVVLTE